MTHRNSWLLLAALTVSPGCGLVHTDAGVDETRILRSPSVTEPLGSLRPAAVAPSRLESCFAAGGQLVEVATVDNNDQHDHGALLTFGVSPGGILAAAGEDGTLKFWTLDATLVGSVDGSAITYGAEVGGSPITDVAFMGERALVGDVRGLVQQMGADGAFGVLGGTSPDVPIVAVAFDAATGRFAHAQMGDVVPLTVRSTVDGSTVEILETLPRVRDLAFSSTGALWVAGANAEGPALEVRDGEDPSVVLRRLALEGSAPIEELALSADGETAIAVAGDFLYVVEGDRVRAFPASEHGAASVATTRTGAFALSVGTDGALVARSSADGLEVARTMVVRPVAVRVDASDALVVVGGQDAQLHAFACEE